MSSRFKINRTIITLCGIWFIAFLLRVYRLGSLPANLMEDEVLSGYVGRFILQNGVDLYGNHWPLLYFDKFGDYYIIGPMYLAGLSTFLFGVTSFAVRFPAALFGSLIVFPLYYFVRQIVNQDKIALLAAALIAIAPWHVVLSRSSVEGIIGSTVFLTAIVLFQRYFRTYSKRSLFVSFVLFLSTYFIYHPFRMYVPVVFLPFFVLYFSELKNNKRKLFIPLSFIVVFFFALTIYISSTPWGSGRFDQTSIFSPLARVEGAQQEQIYNIGGGRILEARIFHNKYVGFGREYIRQYLSYFSPNYLFTSGGATSRYDVPEVGLLYLSYLFLIVVAIMPIKTNIKVNSRMLLFYLYLLLLAPIPAAFTYYGSPNIHRSVFFAVMLVIPAAFGAYKLAHIKYSKIIFSAFIAVLMAEILYFWHQYSTQSDSYTAMNRNDAQADLVRYLVTEKSSNEDVYLPNLGTMSLYVLFYSNNFDSELAGKFETDVRLDKVGKFNFVESSCPTNEKNITTTNIIAVDRYDCPVPENYTLIKSIKGKNLLLGFNVYQR